jgi:hypothetical protein
MKFKMHAIAAVSIAVLISFGSWLRAADTLPNQLDDDAFWQLIESS